MSTHLIEMLTAAIKACGGLRVEHSRTPGAGQICITTPDGKKGVRIEVESLEVPEKDRVYLASFLDRAQTTAPVRYRLYHDDDPAPLETLFRTVTGPLRRGVAET